VRISLSLGEKDVKRAERILGNAAFLNLVFAIVLTAAGFLTRESALRIFGAGEETMGYAVDYYTIILAGVPFSLMGFSLNNVIRSEGNARIAMFSMFISAGLNIILDPIFIFGLGMGVKGAAYATVISQVVLCIWVLSHFRGRNSVIKFRKVNFQPDKAIIVYILSIGFAPFSMQLAASLVNGIMNAQLIRYGGDMAVGAMGIVNSITVMLVMSIISINMATQPIVGYNYGAGNHCRVKEAVLLAVKYASIVAVVGWALCMFTPGTLVSIFNSESETLRQAGVQGLRIYCAMLPVVGYQIIASSYFQAIGQAKLATFISMLRQVIVLLPLLVILPLMMGVEGVWIANPVSDFIAAVISFLFFRRELKKLRCDIPAKEEDPLSVPATTY